MLCTLCYCLLEAYTQLCIVAEGCKFEFLHGSGCVVVRLLARDTKGREFDSRLLHFQVTTLGKLFTHMCLCHQAV